MEEIGSKILEADEELESGDEPIIFYESGTLTSLNELER